MFVALFATYLFFKIRLSNALQMQESNTIVDIFNVMGDVLI